MQNGRPAHNSICTKFYPAGSNQYINSLKVVSDVSGWQKFTGTIDKEGRLNGEGK
jgi:hypothetical protein